MLRYLNGRSQSILSAALVIGVAGVGSRLLGIVRDRLLSARFGAGDTVDAYVAAFRIPDALFGLFVIGAIASAFIPVFSEYLFTRWGNGVMTHAGTSPLLLKDKPEALKLAVSVLNTLVLIVGLLAGAAFVFAPDLATLIAPGFSTDKRDLTALLLRIMLVQPIILAASNVVGAVLQTFRQFVAYALAPVFYNMGIIVGIVFLVPLFHQWYNGAPGLALGVVLAALLHLIIQLPSLRSTGFRWRPIIRLNLPGQWQIFKLMLPRTLGIAGDQAGLIVLTAIASTLAAGSNAILYYSDNIRSLPGGIIGVAFSIAAFPALSASMAQKQVANFAESLTSSLRHILYLVIPLAVVIYFLRAHLVRVILGTAKYTWPDTTLTIAMVGAFAFTIVFQALVPLFAKAFYAMQNTRLPVIVALMSAAIIIGSAFFFTHEFHVGAAWTLVIKGVLRIPDIPRTELLGLALAFGLGAVFQAATLAALLAYKLRGLINYRRLGLSLMKTLAATLALAIVLYATRNFLSPLATDPDLHTTLGLFFQAAFAATAGALAFLITTSLLEAEEVEEFLKLIPKLKKSH